MNILIIFIASSIASFIGSLQLGPVNLFVIDATLNTNKKSAYWVAFGGVIPEFIYCALAVYLGNYFLINPTIFLVFKILLILILTILGIIFLFKKNKKFEIEFQQKEITMSNTKSFFKGFTLAILNPQLLPFWMFVMVYFNSITFLELKSDFDKLAYILGAGLGALFLLISIILTVNKLKSKFLNFLNNKYYYKVIALLFFLIALQQLITIQ